MEKGQVASEISRVRALVAFNLVFVNNEAMQHDQQSMEIKHEGQQ